jgi:hypothetical protein
MRGCLKIVLFGLVVVLSQIALAQQATETTVTNAPVVSVAKSTSKGDAKPAAKAPKLTPDQILANQTLESAESQSRGLEAPMRSYSLIQIAGAFAASNPDKARGLLHDAFSASLAVQDDPFARENLQHDIFLALLPISMSDVEERLAQAEPRPRKQAADGIIARYIEKKQFGKAVDLVEAVASLDEFPYAAGGRLMEALPAEMNAEKQTLFASAAASFRAHEHKGAFVTMGDNSFTGLLIRFGDSIPPKLALESIDETLSQARKNDVKFSVTVGGEGGSASFNSNYEYQLFAVLPLLRKLDESGADKLLQENAALQSTMQKYPNGMDSVSPKPAPATDKGAQPKRRGTSFNVSDNGSKASADEVVRQEIMLRSNLILQEAETDPTQAIAQASALPLTIPLWTSPRALTLEGIARANIKKQPASARQAVAELRKAVADLPLRDQFTFISHAADIYLQIDDKDKAEDVVSDGLGIAAKLLDHDINPDDPNKALKAWWPSTDAYRRLVEIETKISHPATAKLLQEIKDPDIRALESIMFARALLGLPMKYVTVAEKNKDGNRTRTTDGN